MLYSKVQNVIYCVEWDVKPYYTILYHTSEALSTLCVNDLPRVDAWQCGDWSNP